MSIQSEIDRITNAKAAIKTAIEGKGVTVPEATLLDGMAALIESIEAGGGAPSLQSKSITYTANGTATITPDEGYDGLSSVDVTVDVASGGGATIPGIVELFTTSGLRYSPKYDAIINITFSAWPKYFGVYCIDGENKNIFIGPSVYFGDMAGRLTIDGAIEIIDVNFGNGIITANVYAYKNYYFLSDVEMTIGTQ